MSRIAVGNQNKTFARPSKPMGGARKVARLFVPSYQDGIWINTTVRLNRNSDARRRLARLFESRRVVS